MKCEICGKEIGTSAYSGAVLCSTECFYENFWRGILAEKDKYFVIGGNCYEVGPEGQKDCFRGFGGSRFHLRNLGTGEVTVTSNLWFRGEVPEKFRNALPDTHKFGSKE